MIPGITGTVLVAAPVPPLLAATFIDWPINVANLSQSFSVSGGVAPYTYSIISGSLPTGLSLNASTGAITGTPTVGGLSSFTARVVDFLGQVSDLATGITIEADASWANVKFLAGLNGANNQTTYTSEDTAARTATFVGNAKLSTAQAKFGSASALFDGSGDYITFPDSGDWTLGSADFTIEYWLRVPTLPGASVTWDFLAHYNSTSNQRGWDTGLSPDGSGNQRIRFLYSTDGTGTNLFTGVFAAPILANTWHAIAYSRVGADLHLFCDGVLVLTHNISTRSIFNSTAALSLGAVLLSSSGTNYANGYLDEVRITTGVGRYSADYTPRVFPFPRG